MLILRVVTNVLEQRTTVVPWPIVGSRKEEAMALEVSVINLTYKRGDSRAIVFVLKDGTTGDPLDLTSYTLPVLAVNTLSTPPDTSTELFKVTGVFDGDRTTGRISFSPTIVDSDQTPDTYFYDAQVSDAATGIVTFVEGKFKITQDRAKD